MKTIELIIGPTGHIRLVTQGFSGDNCLQAAAFLRQSLGKVTHETRTPDFYSTESESQSPLTMTTLLS